MRSATLTRSSTATTRSHPSESAARTKRPNTKQMRLSSDAWITQSFFYFHFPGRIVPASNLPSTGYCLCQVCAKKFPSPYEGSGKEVPWTAFPQLISHIRLNRRTRSLLDQTRIHAGRKRPKNSQEPSQNPGKGNWDSPNLQKIGHLIFQTR